MSENFSADRALESAVAQEEIDADDIRADRDKAAIAAVQAMSDDDLVAMGQLAQKQPELLKLKAVGEKMLPIRVAMEAEPLSNTDMATINSIVVGIVEEYQK